MAINPVNSAAKTQATINSKTGALQVRGVTYNVCLITDSGKRNLTKEARQKGGNALEKLNRYVLALGLSPEKTFDVEYSLNDHRVEVFKVLKNKGKKAKDVTSRSISYENKTKQISAIFQSILTSSTISQSATYLSDARASLPRPSKTSLNSLGPLSPITSPQLPSVRQRRKSFSDAHSSKNSTRPQTRRRRSLSLSSRPHPRPALSPNTSISTVFSFDDSESDSSESDSE